jgi:hypothetical protein
MTSNVRGNIAIEVPFTPRVPARLVSNSWANPLTSCIGGRIPPAIVGARQDRSDGL